MGFGKRVTAPERRALPRVVGGDGVIILQSGATVKCRVINYSETGAKLGLTTVLGIPERFALQFGRKPTRNAVVVRRENAQLAVRFE